MVNHAKLDEAIETALTPGKYAVILVSSRKAYEEAREYTRNRYRGYHMEIRFKADPGEEIVYFDADPA